MDDKEYLDRVKDYCKTNNKAAFITNVEQSRLESVSSLDPSKKSIFETQ